MSIISVSAGCKSLVMNLQPALSMESSFFRRHHRKDKVVVIMGATGTGKSKLAIDVAAHFPPAEVVNSDKMQVYKGLDITTNKVTEEECRGVPHHLLGTIDPNANFSATDFCHHATQAVDSIVERDGLPIIAGGSNSFIDALVNHHAEFRLRYACCFLWVDVSLPVLHSSLSARVDRMIEAGQLDEVRGFFDPASADYSRGIRRAIGVPEFDEFLRAEEVADEGTGRRLLEAAIARIKVNNCALATKQIQKIHRLHGLWKRSMHRLDATEVFLRGSKQEAEQAWEDHVFAKTRRILNRFLYNNYDEAHHHHHVAIVSSPKSVVAPPSPPPPAMAAATH